MEDWAWTHPVITAFVIAGLKSNQWGLDSDAANPLHA